MGNLLIDIGNSKIKLALASGNKLLLRKEYLYSKKKISIEFNNILKKYKKLVSSEFSIDKIGISLLQKTLKFTISQSLKSLFDFERKITFISYNSNLPLKFKYSKTIGSDRICSVVAAYSENKKKRNILVVDFGTATTYNLISNNTFIGGLIAPGIYTSYHSLINKTSLPKLNLSSSIKLISNNTKDNIRSGILFQALFAFERIVFELKKNYADLFIIVTGGNSKYIIKKSKLIDHVDTGLVLKGINFILNKTN